MLDPGRPAWPTRQRVRPRPVDLGSWRPEHRDRGLAPGDHVGDAPDQLARITKAAIRVPGGDQRDAPPFSRPPHKLAVFLE